MKVLVMGGTGNISREVVYALLKTNHEPVLFNRGRNPDPPPPDVRVIKGDRRNREDFASKMSLEKFDAVIDMICFDAEDAASSLRAFQGRVEHLVHCSTVMTYGPPFAGINLDETASLNGESEYALGKIASERLFLRAYLENNFPVTIFRPSLTFGANVLLPQAGGDGSWIHRLRQGKPLLSVGDGLNYFQFLPSKDAAIAFAAVLGRKQSIGEIYNLVHPVPRTWDHWHREVAEALGVEIKLVHVPQETLIAISPARFGQLKENFGHTQVFDGAKLSTCVPEFQPRESLVTSIAESIAWMDSHNLVPESHDGGLEDRIIARMEALPFEASWH